MFIYYEIRYMGRLIKKNIIHNFRMHKRTHYALYGETASTEKDTDSIFSSVSSLSLTRSELENNRKDKWTHPLSSILSKDGHVGASHFKYGPFWGGTKMPLKQYEIFKHVVEYFTIDILRNRVVPLINRKAEFSLRLIDWFVVNYATEIPVIYKWGDKVVNVKTSYQEMMRRYKRRFFDPFRRKMRLYFTIPAIKTEHGEDETFNTTVGQLLYFRWAFENGIIEQASLHIDQIYAHMVEKIKEKDKIKEESRVSGKHHKRSPFVQQRSHASCFANNSDDCIKSTTDNEHTIKEETSV